MSEPLGAFLEICPQDQFGLNDASTHDLVITTSAASQKILMGASIGQATVLCIADGRVGINTSTPEASRSLHVQGDISFYGNLYQNGQLFTSAGGTSNASAIDGGVLAVQYGGTGNTSLGKGYLLVGNGTDPILDSSALVWNGVTEQLIVQGDISFFGNLYQNGNLFVAAGDGTSNASAIDSGVLAVQYGGTGNTSLGKGYLLVGNGTDPILDSSALVWNGVTEQLTVQGNVVPSEDATYDLGSSALRWRDLYLSNNSLYIGNVSLSMNATGDLSVKDDTGNQVVIRADIDASNITRGSIPSDRLPEVDGASNTSFFYINNTTPYRTVTSAPGMRFRVDRQGRVILRPDGEKFPDEEIATANPRWTVVQGGTGTNLLPLDYILVGRGTSAIAGDPKLQWNSSSSTLTVTGNIRGSEAGNTYFIGDGSGLTNLNASRINAGTLSVNRGGTGSGGFVEGSLILGNGTASSLKEDENLWYDTFNSSLVVGAQNRNISDFPPYPSGSTHLYVDGDIGVKGKVLPEADVTYDLGSDSNRWNRIFLDTGRSIFIGSVGIEGGVDASNKPFLKIRNMDVGQVGGFSEGEGNVDTEIILDSGNVGGGTSYWVFDESSGEKVLHYNEPNSTVLIGNTISSQSGTKLEVYGGDIWCEFDVNAFSDERLKGNLKVIDHALDKIHSVSGYTFDRLDAQQQQRRHAGLISQEVEKVLPEVITQSQVTGYKSLAYGNFVALLTEAIKELSGQVKTLQTRLDRANIG